jgi:hypothetical protein
MYAFVSYRTADKAVAGRVRDVLAGLGIEAFLAHEDIHVSEEWRLKILREIGRADLFIAILSKNYFRSAWCIQESGIAAFRKGMTIVPLSIDGTIPRGFLSHIQSSKIDPKRPWQADLFPGIAKRNLSFVIDKITKMIEGSRSYRSAEANFETILPYLSRAKNAQILRLLEVSAENNQVYHASKCAREYLPPLLESHGHLLKAETRKFLEDRCEEYAT